MLEQEEQRYLGRRVENLGANVEKWCDQTGNGSSTIDLCKSHAARLDKDPHCYDRILQPFGTDGWGGDIEHPNFDDSDYRCAIPNCKILLGGW